MAQRGVSLTRTSLPGFRGVVLALYDAGVLKETSEPYQLPKLRGDARKAARRELRVKGKGDLRVLIAHDRGKRFRI